MDEQKVEAEVVALLLANHMTISTVESCTGGKIAAKLIQVAGVSETYQAGFVTYSNKSKRKLVGVKKKTLNKYGAVSPQTASEMAAGAARTVKTDVAVSSTGIAGPDGGSEDKPVGLVYLGCTVGKKTAVMRCQFQGNREEVREQAAKTAIIFLKDCLIKHCNKLKKAKNKEK
ncbi:MAG: CinA family protein [Lachnospiraceae bacterium]|nr:CinA family protein [Lachnospiraceae bacterium]